MSHYHIAADSCTDHGPDLRDESITYVPLTLSVDGEEIIDDETFDRDSFLKKIAASETGGRSACPSPQSFMDAYGDDDDDAYAITLSSVLSGSYNSAVVGAKMLQDDRPNKKIHVFDSKSAASGQTLILMKLRECLKAGLSFEKTEETVERYISEQTTVFVLETLDAFIKNGRIRHLEGLLGKMLGIKPVLGSTPEGNIQRLGLGRGTKQALQKLVNYIGISVTDPANKILGITHCNCRERALALRDEIMTRYHFKDAIVLESAGVSTLYAADGGIVVAY